MKKTIATTLTCAFLGAITASAQDAKPSAPEPPVVQIAILLDTSSSMNGLIEQAKSQLWKVVNEFISAKQNGQTPTVQVALYKYGNSGLEAETHWIRQIQPLTRDLDKVSEELFKLTTNGGDEFCGAVIERAIQDLRWDVDSNTFKTIFIAGNEPFTQGPIDSKTACQSAIAAGVTVNTIHCGAEGEGINGGWKSGALLADGSFMIIDQNKAVAHIEAPQDVEIEKLNNDLNDTYIVFGKKGNDAKMNQIAQDSNSVSRKASGAAVQRVVTKASANYWNATWDLCDACKQKDFKLEDVKAEDLPENMRAMTLEERKTHIAEMTEKRAAIQKQILGLNEARNKYVADKRREAGENDTLDAAMITAIRGQAAEKKIVW